MKQTTPQWLQGCTVCNVGLISRMDELISEGKSEKSAARILEAEAFEANGNVLTISKHGIRHRYRKYKKGKTSWENKTGPNGSVETQLRQSLRYLRTAGNKLEALNLNLGQHEVTEIDGIEALLGKVDIVKFTREFLTFIQYFQAKGLIADDLFTAKIIKTGKE